VRLSVVGERCLPEEGREEEVEASVGERDAEGAHLEQGGGGRGTLGLRGGVTIRGRQGRSRPVNVSETPRARPWCGRGRAGCGAGLGFSVCVTGGSGSQ
jgi:hypothetical protein